MLGILPRSFRPRLKSRAGIAMMTVAPEPSNRSPVARAAELLVSLSSAGLLRHDPLTEVGPLAERGADLKEMTRELSRRGWLTRFQITMALHGRVMEYVDGFDLSRRVKESGPLPVERACAYA
jgi:hypothetical protein